ncbi:MAG: tetratricopeptide repeat protein [Leptolyngbya sp. PLA3]|nr:MAG: tetratricopeptide repeat protein [Cyanobacteria bacterium CYA]MCE7968323.1 tetratricopeptide repeat protein [Leptolyngbya sp. PL-A3]
MESPVQTRAFVSILLAAGLVLAPGCGGQGRYTREGSSLAKEKMNVMKSATEWEMSRQAFLAGDLEKALRKIDTSLEVNPSVAKSHVLKGRILLEMGEIGLAQRSFETAMAIQPDNVDAHYYNGLAFERLTKFEEALAQYRAAAALDTYNDQFVIAAAETLIDLERCPEAATELRQSPAFDHSAGIRQTLGHVAQLQGNIDEAVAHFEAARLLAPDDMDILEDLTRAQYLHGDCPDAAYGLEILLKHVDYAGRRDLLRMQAECMLKLDRTADARQVYLKLTQDAAGAGDADAWIGLGNVSFVVNDMNTLRRSAARVVAIAPDRKEGYVLWTLLHRAGKNPESALRSIDDAIVRDARDPTLQTMRALVLLDLGRPDAARVALDAALKLDPANAPAHAVLARIDRTVAEVPTP